MECASACLWCVRALFHACYGMERVECKCALPALPYDPGEQGDPLHAVAPAGSKGWKGAERVTIVCM